jgi:hypothetical protein
MESMSLLYALLETEPPADPSKGEQKRLVASRSKVDAYKSLPAEKRDPVLDDLYQILYFIIEHHDLPHNRILNRAIGKVLAKAIRDEIPDLVGDKDIEKLYNMLKPMVTEAIEEVNR